MRCRVAAVGLLSLVVLATVSLSDLSAQNTTPSPPVAKPDKPVEKPAPSGKAPEKSSRDVYKDDLAGNDDVEKVIKGFAGKGAVGDDSEPTPPLEATKQFKVAEGVEIELVAAEPDVAQPLYISFDPRGRMWVVQYLQYPFPAGLKVVKYDQYLRAVFDKVPPPPPHHFVGKDKVTVWEDTDADGKYDSHKDIVDGLNIVSSALAGDGGFWVLNPPYLLFYPDANGDDVPDGDPVVHLSGFGLEDTHSVANSLRWGPDGWLYGANGSTTTANINSAVTKNVRFLGQCIWRYHPVSQVFEIFAEGGGNTFSLEMDGKGRVFSGTNGGGTRGMFYPQGSYGVKGWAKHGPLTNPFAFGYFEHMRHQGDGDRFPQTFSIYEADNLPEKYRGTIIAANALHNRVWASELLPDSSTYRTVDMPPVVTTPDRWFRPVDIKLGPDGAVYLADWYDTRLTHVDPRDNWHKASGRIYRLQGTDRPKPRAGEKPFTAVDMPKLSDDELIGLFTQPNRWVRETAVRVLGWRLAKAKTGKTLEKLAGLARGKETPLEALWVLNLAGKFDASLAAELLAHSDEHVRRWTIRLLGDERRISDALGKQLATLGATEPYVQVRTQLASSAKRFDTDIALPILRELLKRDEDRTDLHQPLLVWWAIEAHCGDPSKMLAFFKDPAVWRIPMVQEVVLERLMQRYAMADVGETPGGTLAAPDAGTGLTSAAKLLALAPTPEDRKKVVAGFLEAYQGRKIEGLPPELVAAIDDYQASAGKSDLALGLRLGKSEAIDEAIKLIANEKGDRPQRLAVIDVLGQTKPPKAMSPLINLLSSPAVSIKRAALVALMNYDDPAIGQQICSRYHSQLPDQQDLRSVAHRVLASRPAWTKSLLTELAEWRIKSNTIAMDVVQQMRLHQDPEIQKQLDKLWGKTRASSEQKQTQMKRLHELIARQRTAPAVSSASSGAFDRGHELFKKNCATCHTLFGEGGQTGPNLTGYERDNLNFLLLAVVDPSAAIREEFTQFIVVTTDGRVLNGLIDKQDARTVSLRGANNQTTLLNRDDIEELKATETSIMPDGLTDKLTDAEIQDLFTYVMTKAPPK